MRHFYRMNTAGELTGCVTHPGGFTDVIDPSDPNTSHPIALSHRRACQSDPNHIGGFDRLVRYECPCPSDLVRCQCPHTNLANFYFDGSGLSEKPTVEVIVDGVATDGRFSTFDYPPGTRISLRLKANAPNGHAVLLQPVGQAAISKTRAQLVFTDGVTQATTLVAPAQGMKGSVVGQSTYIRPFSVELCGWA